VHDYWRTLGTPPAPMRMEPAGAMCFGPSRAEIPENVLARYRTEGRDAGLVAWRRGDLAGIIGADANVTWSVSDYPSGVIQPWQGKGGGRVELDAYRSWPPDFVVLSWDGGAPRGYYDERALAWFTERQDALTPLFPAGLGLGGVVTDA
jgi:hypothetical protein